MLDFYTRKHNAFRARSRGTNGKTSGRVDDNLSSTRFHFAGCVRSCGRLNGGRLKRVADNFYRHLRAINNHRTRAVSCRTGARRHRKGDGWKGGGGGEGEERRGATRCNPRLAAAWFTSVVARHVPPNHNFRDIKRIGFSLAHFRPRRCTVVTSRQTVHNSHDTLPLKAQ